MNNNTLLAHLVVAFSLSHEDVARLLALGGCPLDLDAVTARLRARSPARLTDRELGALLDGLIVDRRGPRADGAPPNRPVAVVYPNNAILKKLRIALNFHEEEMADAFAAGGDPLDHYALGALFRSEGQKQFRPCSDARLLAFLDGVARTRSRA